MSKLLELKEFLTLDEAVLYIAKEIHEPVSIADLYRFAFDGHVTLSVNFVNCGFGLQGKWVKSDDIEYRFKIDTNVIDPKKHYCPKSPKPNEMRVSEDEWVSWEDDIEPLIGVWDLTMKGEEAFDLKNYYHKLTSGVSVTHPYTRGILLQQGEVVCQLYKRFESDEYNVRDLYDQIYPPQEIVISDIGEIIQAKASAPNNVQGLEFTHYMFFNKIIKSVMGIYFVPCSSLDEQDDVQFVIRTKELTRFIQSLEDIPLSQKPLTSLERSQYLVLIAVLCKKVDIDWKCRGITSSLICMTEQIGASLGYDTILGTLKQIEPAILSISTTQNDKPLTTQSRNSLLVLIAALCKQANIDWNQSSAEESLAPVVKSIGATLDADTICDIFTQIDSAVDSRCK